MPFIMILGGNMKTAEIKKGMRILLNNGWYGTMKDNMRGTRRLAEVEGYQTEIGSVYSFNITAAKVDGLWVQMEYTPKELEVKKMDETFLGQKFFV